MGSSSAYPFSGEWTHLLRNDGGWRYALRTDTGRRDEETMVRVVYFTVCSLLATRTTAGAGVDIFACWRAYQAYATPVSTMTAISVQERDAVAPSNACSSMALPGWASSLFCVPLTVSMDATGRLSERCGAFILLPVSADEHSRHYYPAIKTASGAALLHLTTRQWVPLLLRRHCTLIVLLFLSLFIHLLVRFAVWHGTSHAVAYQTAQRFGERQTWRLATGGRRAWFVRRGQDGGRASTLVCKQ
jgi:hypothetical protein